MTGSGRALPRIAAGTMLAALAVAAAVAVVRILTHHPFHDECLHLEKLYLMSVGLEPHRDFWCNYPVPAYVLTLPVLALLPKTAGTFLALRFLMLVPIAAVFVLFAHHGRRIAGSFVWGVAPASLILVMPAPGRFLAEYSIDHPAMLAAVAAIVLICAPPRPLRVGAAATLALLSVALTPKYGAPLAIGTGGLLLATLLTRGRRRSGALALAGGAAVAVLLVLGLYALGGTSIVANVRYSHLLMAEFKLAAGADSTTLAATTVSILLRNLPLTAVVILGLWGWSGAVRTEGLRRHLGPIGILVGTLASALLVRSFMLQYVLPVLIGLAAFAPWAARRFATSAIARTGVAVVTLGWAALGLVSARGEFTETPINVRDTYGVVARDAGVSMGKPAIEVLRITRRLLDRIPESERVLAVPMMSPVFRRGLTYMTADEVPSFYRLLPADDPARPYFTPAHLRERLAETAPAYLCLEGTGNGLPRGWRPIMEEFLDRHRDRYVPIPELPQAWLRVDLAREPSPGW